MAQEEQPTGRDADPPSAAQQTPEAAPAPPGPFDHPYFLPGLLFAIALWFGYDGWFNEEIESIWFNRIGFGVLLLAALYFTRQNMNEGRDSKD